jgi:salicylate hydroxylase
MRDVLIAGAGIAGLAAALALARCGVRVTVRERADALRAFGAGLQVSPNGMVVLDGLGIGAAVRVRSLENRAVVPCDALTGQPIARFALVQPANWRFIHRADLLDILADAARLAGVDIQTGQEVTPKDLGPGPGMIIGADGLHALTRAVLNPDVQPFFTGQVAWRAVVPGPHPAEARVWMGPGFHVVTYPLQGERVNIVAVREQQAWAEDGWAHAAAPADLIAAFPTLCPPLRDLFGAVSTVHRWGLHRYPVADRWTNGRLVLLGDSAHPTLPFLAQGANLALEDAWTLAALTARAPDLAAALARFQAVRAPRVTKAIAGANANARSYHLRGPARHAAHLALRVMGATVPGAFLSRFDWLYRHDVTRLFPLDAPAPHP